MTPQTSIIIVNWNTRQLLLQCLSSIRTHAAHCEVLVVDNGSTDGSHTAIEHEFPEVRIIRHAENKGYARANNAGVRAAAGEYLLFLNSDTILMADTVALLSKLLHEHPGAAACSPRLLQQNGKAQPFAFGGDPTLKYLLARASARFGIRKPMHNWDTATLQTVDWVSGACLLIRRSAFEQVGGFDEKIFMFFEDNDLCLRLRQAGWNVLYAPHIAVIHLGGGSLAGSTHRNDYYYRSLKYFYSKHYSALECAILRMLLPIYRLCFG